MISQRVEAPVVGYRVWIAERGRLRSATSNDYWPSGAVEAHCGDGEPHQAPAPECACGIYVCDSKETALRYRDQRRRWRPWLRHEDVVVGAVQLWGSPGRPVIVGELRPDLRGRAGLQYRAPFARIVALADGPGAGPAGRALGVPVVHPEYLEAFAREVGGVQLRPPAPRWRLLDSVRGAVRPAEAGRLAAAMELARRLQPPAGVALRALARFAWWLLKWFLRITWWLTCRSVWLAVLVVVAVVGHALDTTAPRRHR